MTDVVVDPALRATLHDLDGPLRFRDEAGRVLGYFYRAAASDYVGVKSPISDEEIERRCQSRTGRPLSEIIKRLEQL